MGMRGRMVGKSGQENSNCLARRSRSGAVADRARCRPAVKGHATRASKTHAPREKRLPKRAAAAEESCLQRLTSIAFPCDHQRAALQVGIRQEEGLQGGIEVCSQRHLVSRQRPAIACDEQRIRKDQGEDCAGIPVSRCSH